MSDEMYKVPLGEFTAARDAQAARLKAAGDTEAAAEVKRARKPSVPAWAANQVVWHAGDTWERLRTAAEALRRKHQKGASAEDLREAGREQREALQAAEAWAAERLAQHGHAAGPTVLQKVGHTLLALVYGASGATPGRLEHELQPPGFEALAGMTLGAPAPAAAVASPPAADRATARSAKEPAPNARSKAQQKAEEREEARRRAALAAAEERQEASRRALQKARARLETEEERRRALEKQLDAVRDAREEARRGLEAAEAEVAAAEADVRARRAGLPLE